MDNLRDALPGVGVHAWWPGEQRVTAQMLWIDEIASEVDAPVMTGGRLHRDDIFLVRILGRVTGLASEDATWQRIEEIAAAIDNEAAANDQLDDLDGVLSVELTSGTTTCGRTPDGFLGYSAHEVRIHSRLT